MNFFDVLFYNYYRYSIKVLKDEEPHGVTNFMLSASQSTGIIGILSFVSAKFFCYQFASNKLMLFLIFGIVFFINYIIYIRNRRSKKVIKEVPVLFGSNKFSIIVTIIFFLVTTSWLFWGVPYMRVLLNNCH